MAIPLSTLQTWYDEALTAKQKLLIGGGVVRVSSPDGSVEFSQSDMGRLDAWINQLAAWIAAGGVTSGSAYRPIYITF